MGASILLVEDEIELSGLIEEYLSSKGCFVAVCHTGIEAVEAFKNRVACDVC